VDSVWLKKCLAFLVKELQWILNAEPVNVGLGLHHRIWTAQLNLHVKDSRWGYRKEGCEHAERPGDVDDHSRDEYRNYCVGDVLAQDLRCEVHIAAPPAGGRR
jgi:hypothetical protein